MDFDQILFGEKTFSNLLQDIYKTSRDKEKELKTLISQLKDLITEPSDAVLIVPLIKGYFDVAVKNDEALIKIASIVQKAMTANTNSDDPENFLSTADKELIFAEIKQIKEA